MNASFLHIFYCLELFKAMSKMIVPYLAYQHLYLRRKAFGIWQNQGGHDEWNPDTLGIEDP
jgi:hypothetical protein